MEKIKAEEVEKTYLVHWDCIDCKLSNTHETQSSKQDDEVVECWDCECKYEISWEF